MANSRRAPLPTTSPSKLLLLRLRGFVELLVPFDKARVTLDIDDATHRRWLREGRKILGPDEQSDDDVAEYARLCLAARASQVTTLARLRGRIATNPQHPQQLKAIEGALEWFDRNPEEKSDETGGGLGISPSDIACLPPSDQAEMRAIALQARQLANRAREIVARNRGIAVRSAQVAQPPGTQTVGS